MGAEESRLESDTDDNELFATDRKLVTFFLNGQECKIDPSSDGIAATFPLVDYIRDVAGYKGTKVMCREGGCGACVVSVKMRDVQTGLDIIQSVNSCLVPTLACDGWDITTIEKVGNKQDGYHVIQQSLVNANGSQCGYCSPGFVTSMYSLMQSKSDLSALEIEENFDGNICRCTGYRPILDAFKSLATSPDIESCITSSTNCGQKKCRQDFCGKIENFDRLDHPGHIQMTLSSGEEWVTAKNLKYLFATITRAQSTGKKYRLVAGNTGTGVFKDDGPYDLFIDINGIEKLTRVTIKTDTIILGSGVTLTKTIDSLRRSSQFSSFEYTHEVSEHLKRVANVAVRNLGTLGGNLMLKHGHPEFVSDVFTLLATVGAQLTIARTPSLYRKYSMDDFLSLNMTGQVIISVHLPKLDDGYKFRSFKISPRYQNAIAHVNAGFLIKLTPTSQSDSSTGSVLVLERPRIVFGGIHRTFVRASEAENFLVGKNLSDPATVRGVMNVLDREIVPDYKSPDARPGYRKGLTQSLLFKFVVGLLGERISAGVKSAGIDIQHGLTTSKQVYDTSEDPLYQPVTKLETPAQVSGSAEYIMDIQPQHGELFGVFVLSKVANADLKSLDASEALALPRVVAFIEAKDIPGVNNYLVFAAENEPIFVQTKISYAGQPLGLILAEDRETAQRASKLVKISYDNVKKPILTFSDALQASNGNDDGPLSSRIFRESVQTENNCNEGSLLEEPSQVTVVKGEFETGHQYHFHLETQTCICIPRENSMDVYSATQHMDQVQQACANALALPNNFFNVQCRRLGGSYGGKLSRAALVATACAVAAYRTNCPVRIALSMEDNMAMIGKRLPYLFEYEAGVNSDGKILRLTATVTCDAGCTSNEVTSWGAMMMMQSCYQANDWLITPGKINTNLPSNTYCRAPGSTQGIGAIESIMDHIAFVLEKDPLDIRMINFLQIGDTLLGTGGKKFQSENLIPKLIEEMKLSGELENRTGSIKTFNQNNRWKKRGLSTVPMRYGVHSYSGAFKSFVAIYADGSVVVSHSGIEMGQGINTKVAQVVAHELKIPLENIRVTPSTNVISANCSLTGGSTTSQLCAYAALKACEILKERMAPIKTTLVDPTWKLWVAKCLKANVDLTASYQLGRKDWFESYDVWGLTTTEVEIDCLTGEYKIVRVDLIEDCGKSISPNIDLGQIEGSIIMGFGYWLLEKCQYDERTGEILTNRTWNYKAPSPADIPEDFRVTLMHNGDNPGGALRSKAVGEPPVCMSISVLLAIKHAITMARVDAGIHDWFQLNGPVTLEDIVRHATTNPNQFEL